MSGLLRAMQMKLTCLFFSWTTFSKLAVRAAFQVVPGWPGRRGEVMGGGGARVLEPPTEEKP